MIHFYNVKYGNENKLDFGDESDRNHLHISMTSRDLISKIESMGINQINGTYRITIYDFHLIV
jgi:hypothetical protein